MKSKIDYATIRDLVLRGHFTDCGGYYAPSVRADGVIVFPSGKLAPDGTFNGASRLAATLVRAMTEPPYGSEGWEARPSDGEAYRQWVSYSAAG